MSAPLLQVEGLDLYYGDAQALSGVSIEIAAGEVVAIVGANGAGKSSLIRAIHGIEKPVAGHVRFDGADIAGRAAHRIMMQPDKAVVEHIAFSQSADRDCLPVAGVPVLLRLRPLVFITVNHHRYRRGRKF